MNLSSNLQFGRTHLVLASLCVLLSGALVYEIAAPLDQLTLPNIVPPRGDIAAVVPAPFAPPPVDAFSAVNDRPVFDPKREAIAPAPAAAATATSPPNIVLVGIIIAGGDRFAMVKTPDSALAVSLQVGAFLDGWLVKSIEPDRIVLHAGSSDDEIRLDASRGNAKVPPVSPPQTPQ